MKKYFEELISFIKKEKPSKRQLNNVKIALCSKYKVKKIPTDIEVLCNAEKDDVEFLNKYLMTKPTRTISGVAVIAIMSAPHACPHGKCIYCPGGIGSFFGDVPQSYTGREPSTMRGIRNDYDSYRVVFNRLEQYIVLGQNPQKAEIIIMGGTFPSFDKQYKEEFVNYIFKAMNDFSREFYKEGKIDIQKFRDFFELPGTVKDKERENKIKKKVLALKKKNLKTLEQEKKLNETSQIRCVGLTIETKPDWGLLEQGNEMLEFGCTRVELGIQTVYDSVLKKINRGHGLKESIQSIRTLKDLGFKLNFHIMPGLPGVSIKQDLESLKTVFDNSDFQPDMLKIYPTLIMAGTPLFEMYKKGLYKPMETKDAAKLIVETKRFIPKYCRIMRIQRDIPTNATKGGVDKTNLRQYVQVLQKKEDVKCNCIRCREIKGEKIVGAVSFEIIEYNASRGKEFFISLVDKADNLVGFCRLRFPSQSLRAEITKTSAIIRELHVYGTAIALGETGVVQHKGFGKRLLEEAEKIARKHKKNKLLVISGVGVKEYYKKFGYVDDGPYVSKNIQ
ncbi:MAG: tRNA uridine(34) 5-carboxymethylaminomethyl modification radical SAM/GNAT enzyme Elp3 [Nanoarchaeota archaeon]|nr:tRNA uridine(34) 5-carboxymethylaminomethyl modification radical SAM/GNAT enzyme Elp3 [Nanoarchaeota archaeon]MBU1269787.1 tRNA uridine(34) 5-carboxymethylaminomethyl modification radical SAM/GNAT enzyme Elp3 [Nanoarchaeota archaeon]MBU1604379.1 tRNA uridine(34) 5-carboxymethylaminomethyl modification radical SAM/GNAT enzyme Elp3 [Nanoarchaeota archaeon]MBU2443764.1 tRNA uridine(34) 5-carboxymethylaminomethyl modification radical SAM/GNAT enzyme Elp3 [Nanoarchaeota archaeon]